MVFRTLSALEYKFPRATFVEIEKSKSKSYSLQWCTKPKAIYSMRCIYLYYHNSTVNCQKSTETNTNAGGILSGLYAIILINVLHSKRLDTLVRKKSQILTTFPLSRGVCCCRCCCCFLLQTTAPVLLLFCCCCCCAFVFWYSYLNYYNFYWIMTRAVGLYSFFFFCFLL